MTDSPDQQGEFFVPDLCATQPVLILFVLAELLVVVYVLGASELPEFSWASLALASLLVQWIVLLCAAVICASRRLLASLSLSAGVALCFGLILLVTFLSSLFAMWVMAEMISENVDYWWAVRNLLVAAVIGGIALRYFYMQQQLRERERAELNARIESLRAKIRPHFLFNTMNSIASLIGSRPEEAERVVEDLSELFRASLIENSRETSLDDELHLCRLYLRIEKLRLGERLSVDWQVDDSLTREALPALLLQPLVENAVYHGIGPLAEGGTIEISVGRGENCMEISVLNPVSATGPAGGGLHMALDNIRQRLAAMYEDGAAMEVDQSEGSHRVTLTIPLDGLPA